MELFALTFLRYTSAAAGECGGEEPAQQARGMTCPASPPPQVAAGSNALAPLGWGEGRDNPIRIVTTL